jgi:hypothetical protein
MLAQLKRTGRRAVAVIWAMALVFAVAPALAMANAVPAGAFSRFLVHAHAHGDEDHVHHGHHHHHHGHAHDEDADHHHHDAVGDGPDDDSGQPRLHVHFDVCCPSVLVSVQASVPCSDRVAGRVTVPRVEPLQGAPPGLLLRPPIPSSLS